MKRELILTHEFVEFIPQELIEGIIYVSIVFSTAVHKCCCGCGNEVVTPLSPTDWELIFDGETISLYPSIGNWGFECQSHYWIRRNRVKWAPKLTRKEIEAGRSHDRWTKEVYFENAKTQQVDEAKANARESQEGKLKEGLWRRLKKRLF